VQYLPRIVRLLLATACIAALAGCGGGAPRANEERPPAPVTLTAAIHDKQIEVSPARVGAGPIVLIVSNQSSTTRRVTFEGDKPGLTIAHSDPIPPHGTGRLTLDTSRGIYRVKIDDRAVRAARVVIGPSRRSSQNDLLLP
jgi:hypothetical protein